MSERWLLPPLWFDMCWEIGAFDEMPFPIAVRSHGATLEERAVLKQRAVPEMRTAGLLAGEHLAPRFHDVLAELAKPSLWIEGLWMPDETTESPARLLCVAGEDGAILLVQQPGETEQRGGDLNITLHPRTGLAAAAVQGMPPATRGKQPRVAVPLDHVAPDPQARQDQNYADVELMRPAVTFQNRASKPARQLRNMLDQQHFRDGQFTASLRDQLGRTHRSSVLKWFDAFEPDGRYGMHQQHRAGNEQEIVLAPVGPAEIGRALESRVAEVRAASR